MFAAGNSVAASSANYIEDVFSTYLYTGNGSTQTITNGIDTSTYGGLVWLKDRSSGQSHALSDTARGVGTSKQLRSNTTGAATTDTFTGFTTSGFTLDASFGVGAQNLSAVTYASWTFRKQPKFFDVVTWTGDGVTTRTVAHNLGSKPGFIVAKATSTTSNWMLWVRGDDVSTGYNAFQLNGTNQAGRSNVPGTSTDSTIRLSNIQDSSLNYPNTVGVTYVAYLFAHNAGGFGPYGTDNVISCGSYTGNGSATGPVVTLGYEPQWLLIKNTTDATNWSIFDNMRGMPVGYADAYLNPNLNSAENSATDFLSPTATGFQLTGTSTWTNGSGSTYIYIAIRRGPMKVPTLGTSVFVPTAATNTTGTAVTTNFPIDMQMFASRGLDSSNTAFLDRLRGYPGSNTDTANNRYVVSSSTAAETTTTVMGYNFWNTSYLTGPYYNSAPSVFYSFRRAPGFFDEVCYTGNSTARTISHNLAAVPELWILKSRDGPTEWPVGSTSISNAEYVVLNTTAAKANGATYWNSTYPTSSVFSVGTSNNVNNSGVNYVSYLFATVAGVSKVGSYTGTGGLQTINCGFSSGARFVLIKRTDSTGGWYVWDSARGLSSGTDPYLLLNSTAAEITGTNYVDTDTTGFQVTASAPADINAVGGTYIFLAIA
jgi:hypothetical protein